MKETETDPLTLRTICAWCQRLIRDGAAPVSHGICAECRQREFPARGTR